MTSLMTKGIGAVAAVICHCADWSNNVTLSSQQSWAVVHGPQTSTNKVGVQPSLIRPSSTMAASTQSLTPSPVTSSTWQTGISPMQSPTMAASAQSLVLVQSQMASTQSSPIQSQSFTTRQTLPLRTQSPESGSLTDHIKNIWQIIPRKRMIVQLLDELASIVQQDDESACSQELSKCFKLLELVIPNISKIFSNDGLSLKDKINKAKNFLIEHGPNDGLSSYTDDELKNIRMQCLALQGIQEKNVSQLVKILVKLQNMPVLPSNQQTVLKHHIETAKGKDREHWKKMVKKWLETNCLLDKKWSYVYKYNYCPLIVQPENLKDLLNGIFVLCLGKLNWPGDTSEYRSSQGSSWLKRLGGSQANKLLSEEEKIALQLLHKANIIVLANRSLQSFFVKHFEPYFELLDIEDWSSSMTFEEAAEKLIRKMVIRQKFPLSPEQSILRKIYKAPEEDAYHLDVWNKFILPLHVTLIGNADDKTVETVSCIIYPIKKTLKSVPQPGLKQPSKDSRKKWDHEHSTTTSCLENLTLTELAKLANSLGAK